MGITSVAVIWDKIGNIVEPMTGEEITKVMEVRNRLIGSMVLDHIMMVDTMHGGQNIGMGDCGLVSRTIAELVFKEEDFATCSSQEDVIIEWFTRRNKGVKSIVLGISSVNIDDIVEERCRCSKSKA